MKRAFLLAGGVVALVAYVWYDVYLLTARPADVTGNLEASVIWGTPAFAVALWRFERRHRKREAAAQARHEERMAYLDAIDAKVDTIHQHLGINLDPD